MLRHNKISITGHLNLIDDDLVKTRLKEKLAELQVGGKIETTIFVGDDASSNSNSKGTDRIAREVCEEIGLSIAKLSDDDLNNYDQLAVKLLESPDHLIAVWDGVYTGKPDGTSDIVYRAMQSRQKVSIHHLIVPRESNAYPISTLLSRTMNFSYGKFDNLPFTIPYTWVCYKHEFDSYDVPIKKRLKDYHIAYVIPIILILLTVLLGMWGFCQLDKSENILNNFFSAVNLINLDTTIIEDGEAGYILNIARFLGLITTIYAFGVAIFFATKKMRKRWMLSFWNRLYLEYTLVLGLSERSYYLINDLRRKGKRVVVMDPNEQSKWKDEVEKSGAIFIDGFIYSVKELLNMKAHRASEIYVFSDDDGDNMRAVQELDLACMQIKKGLASQPKVWAHISDPSIQSLLGKTLSDTFRMNLSIFSIEENIARRLQMYHPFDRYYLMDDPPKKCQMVIFGFDALGRQIVTNALKQGHFTHKRSLKIRVLCKNALQKEAAFLAEYPIFNFNAESKSSTKTIRDNIWKKSILEFVELPNSTMHLMDVNNPLYTSWLTEGSLTSIYFTFSDAVKSASLLTVLLPRLNDLKSTNNLNLQIYCQYNVSDIKEERRMEMHFNTLAPDLPVICYGNYNEECSRKYIQDISLDMLPIEIGKWYENIIAKNIEAGKRVWQKMSENDKESNRQAADHIWIKLRSVWSEIYGQENNKLLLEKLKKGKENKDRIANLARIEHKRWCADLLLKGYQLLEPTDELTKDDIQEIWNDKVKKNKVRNQYLHKDLVPFDSLHSDDDKEKDYSQVMHIPLFLKNVMKK